MGQDEGYTPLLALGVQVWGMVRAKEISMLMGDRSQAARAIYLRPALVVDCGFSQELYWNTTPSGVPGHLLHAGRQVG